MKVLWIHTIFDVGGIERYAIDVLPLLNKHFSVGVVLTHGNEGRWVEKIKKYNIPVYQIKTKGKLRRKKINQATSLIKELSPKIIHAHYFKSHFSFRMASILAKVPVIIQHCHLLPKNRFNNKIIKWEKFLLPLTDKVLFVSPAAQKQYEELLGILPEDTQYQKLISIPIAIDLKPFHQLKIDEIKNLREFYHIPDTAPVIGTISRLAPVKSIETLIEAVEILKKKIPKLKCLIVGSGEKDYTNYLKKITEEKQLKDVIHFAGHSENVAAHLKLLNVYVVSSISEGLPCAIIEAFAAGCPVVASDISSIRDIMTDGKEGLFSKVQDPEDLATAIEKIITNPELREEMSKNALRRAKDFNINEHVEKLCSIYENLLISRDKKIEQYRWWFRLKFHLRLIS